MSAPPVLTRVFLAASILVACQREPAAPAAEPPPAATPPAPPPAPLATVALDRAGLLGALDRAASAYAAGRTTTEDEDVADRRFVVRQAFGCGGPAPAPNPGLAQWTWGRERRSIEIALTPVDWSANPLFGDAATTWEAIEGFWIARPWMREDGCPSTRPATAHEAEKSLAPALRQAAVATPVAVLPAAPNPQAAGLAAVFDEGGSRIGRRVGKPFAFTLRADGAADLDAPLRGFRLVIGGRFTTFPDGRAIHCSAPSPEVRPVCIAAAIVDRVAFEDADGKLLREWRPG